MSKATLFYDDVEEPIRAVVKALREAGINTTSSCGHEMTVEFDSFDLTADLAIIHNTLAKFWQTEYRDWRVGYGVYHYRFGRIESSGIIILRPITPGDDKIIL